MKDKTYLISKIALFVTAIIWGSTFVVVKGATDTMPSNFIMAVRFTVGSIVLGIIFRKKFKLIDRGYIIGGLVMGGSLWIGLFLEIDLISLIL